MNEWLIIHTPRGPHLWNLGDPDDAAREDLVMRARCMLAFPPGEEWLKDFANWQLMVSPGEPEKLRPRATVHDLRDLQTVSSADLDAYRALCLEVCRAATLDAARMAVAALDAEQREALKAELGATPSSTSTVRAPGGRS